MDQLRAWRKAHGFSIEEAGRMVGISGVQWHRYEAGTRSVSADKVPEVAKLTGISPEQLRPDLASIFAPSTKERVTS